MRRWILKAGTINLDGMVMQDAPKPEPSAGEVRVRVRAVSLNYRDQLVLQDPGQLWRVPDRDLVPVADGAGEIDAVGPGVNTWSVGERVTSLYFKDRLEGPPHPGMGLGLGSRDEDGMLAEYVVLPSTRVIRAPDGLSFAEAATLPCAGLTAWSALGDDRPVGSGSKVLVLGTGGVSLFALVLARALGAEVFATTSQDAKKERLDALGAAGVVNYRDVPEWGKAVFDLTGGIDRVVNAAGTGSLNQSMAALCPGGEVAVMGLMTFGDPLDPMLLMGKGVTVRGISVGDAEGAKALAQAINDHKVKPPIDQTFDFEDARSAFQAQSSPELFGKIVIHLS